MNIKIDYKNKLHSIGKDNTSLGQISDAIKIRYPGQFKNGVIIAIIDNGNVHEVRTFEEIVNFWKANGNGASVKIKVFEAPEESAKKEEEKQIILDNADPVYTASVYGAPDGLKRGPENSQVFEIQEEVKPSEQKIVNPFLKNKQLDESMEVKRQPKIQEPKKQEAPVLPNISLEAINKLIQQRVKSVIKQLNLVTRQEFDALKQKQAEVRKEEQKSSILSSIERDLQKANQQIIKPRGEVKEEAVRQYKAKFTSSPLNVVRPEPGSKYTWKVNFTNSGVTAWPKSISVYKTSNKMLEITEVKSLVPGESTEITLDLIAPSSKVSESKQFRLGYIDEKTDSLTFFGPKFGFQLQTNPKPQISSLIHENKESDDTELIRRIIEAAKHVANQRHSIKLLTKSIKQFGLDEKTPKDMLIDAIVQLQTAQLY